MAYVSLSTKPFFANKQGICSNGTKLHILNLSWPGLADLVVAADESCFDIAWKVNSLQLVEDCFGEISCWWNHLFISLPDFGPAHWFGGPEELVQRFPISKTATRQRIPYLPGDMLQVKPDRPFGEKAIISIFQDPEFFLGGVAEPFWVNSLGGAVWVGE